MIRSAKRLAQVKTYYFAKKLREIAELNAKGQDIINLGIGSPDMHPPDDVSQRLIDGLHSQNAHQYQSYFGLPELRAAFAKFYDHYYQVQIDHDREVLPLIGSKEGIMHIAMSFIDTGDEVLIPNPGYPAYKMTTLLADGKPRFYNLTEKTNWLPNFEALQNQDLSRVKLMWVNYPHMPTGSRGNSKLFQDLIAFGHQNNILICHDNPYSFILNSEPNSILKVDGAKETALELFSLSKGHNMAGWRLGAVLTHEDYISAIVKFKSNMDSGMFKPIQLAAIAALNSNQDWFDNLNKTYSERREVAWEIFNSIGAKYNKESSGLFVWAKVPTDNSSFWSNKILNEARVFITPGFIFGTNGESYLRLSLCNTPEQLEIAKERISNIL